MQSALHKQAEFAQQRSALEWGLVRSLINPLWDAVRDPVLDVLWIVASHDWAGFVNGVLPGVCEFGGAMMLGRGGELCKPLMTASADSNGFDHFAACMDAFVNDVRFYSKLQHIV